MAAPESHSLSRLENAGLPPKGNKKKKHREQLPLGEKRPKLEKKKRQRKEDDDDKLPKARDHKSVQDGPKPLASSDNIPSKRTSESSGPGNTTTGGSEPVTDTQESSKSKKPKKAKKDPLRPEPAWLFPPDEENTALNPKIKTKAEEDKEIKEREQAVEYLRHHAVGAPHKPAPPTILLQLVGAFLDSYGFKSTGRVYTAEREARHKMLGWQDPNTADQLDSKGPSLVEIYKQWLATQTINPVPKDRSSNGKPQGKSLPTSVKGVDDTSSDESSSDSDDDSSDDTSDDDESSNNVVSTDAKKLPNRKGSSPVANNSTGTKAAGASNKESLSESDSDSDSDDSDDGTNGVAIENDSKPKAVAAVSSTVPISTVNGMINALRQKKRNVDSDSESDSDSDSDSDSSSDSSPSEPEKSFEKVKVEEKVSKPVKVESAKPIKVEVVEKKEFKPSKPEPEVLAPATVAKQTDAKPSKPKAVNPMPVAVAGKKVKLYASDDTSSVSSSGDEATTASKPHHKANSFKPSVSVEEMSASSEGADAVRGKRKRSASVQPTEELAVSKVPKKNSTPFQRIPSDTKVDPKLSSNAYQPYDYANRAYQDLSVTRGKGFTKEKNKKKRGSYRGGIIDVAGGKGVKFDD